MSRGLGLETGPVGQTSDLSEVLSSNPLLRSYDGLIHFPKIRSSMSSTYPNLSFLPFLDSCPSSSRSDQESRGIPKSTTQSRTVNLSLPRF